MNYATLKSLGLSISVALAIGASSVPCAAQTAESAKSEIVQRLQDGHGTMFEAMVAKDLVHLQMSPAWCTKMTGDDKKGYDAVNYASRGIYDFAKAMGWGDVSSFESTSDTSGASADEKKQRIQSMLNGWKDKVSITFIAEPKTCDSISFDLAMRYLTAVGEVLDSNDFHPPSGVAHITLVASATAKDISVTTSDGKNFTATGPVNHEPDDWGTKLTTGFMRLGKNRIK